MKPRRFVRTFTPQFARLVESGVKKQTVRPTPEIMPDPGDILDAREWTGRPYYSPQRKLLQSIIIKVEPFDLDAMRLREDRDAFARADGFHDWPEMLLWFIHEYSSAQFTGIVIYWT